VPSPACPDDPGDGRAGADLVASAALELASALVQEPSGRAAARVAQAVGRAVQADRVVVLRWDADRRFLEADAVFDLDGPDADAGRRYGPAGGPDAAGAIGPVGMSLPAAALAWLARQPTVARSVDATGEGLLGLLAQAAKVDVGIVLPAVVAGRLQAVIVAGARRSAGDRARDAVPATPSVGGLAAIAALGLRIDALEQQLEHRADHDAVTGLPTLRRVARLAVGQLAEARRRGDPVGVLLVDLDDFAAVNARVGLAGGDRALALVANRLRAAVRGADTVGRASGDAFVIVMAQAGHLAGLQTVAERIVRHLAEPLAVDGVVLAVGATVGVAQSDGGDLGIDGALARADAAVRRARHDGGHRIGLPDGRVVDPLAQPAPSPRPG